MSARSRSRSRDCGEGAESNRSEEHTSELQSPCNLVCRLLLEKKKNATQADPGYTDVTGIDVMKSGYTEMSGVVAVEDNEPRMMIAREWNLRVDSMWCIEEPLE